MRSEVLFHSTKTLLKTMDLTRTIMEHILRKTHVVAIVIAVFVVAGAGIWLAGCDANRIDAEAAISTEEVLAALTSATTEGEATTAIQQLIDKTGLDGSQGASTYRAFGLGKVSRSQLAKDLAAYNKGELAERSFGSVFEDARSGGEPIADDLESTVMVFDAVVADALLDVEDPSAAFVLAIAARGAQLPDAGEGIDSEAAASPVQARLFNAWLSVHGAAMDVYSGKKKGPPGRGGPPGGGPPGGGPPWGHAACDVSDDCPGAATKATICHKPGTPAQKTMCVPLPALQGHLGHGDHCGPCHDQGAAG